MSVFERSSENGDRTTIVEVVLKTAQKNSMRPKRTARSEVPAARVANQIVILRSPANIGIKEFVTYFQSGS